MTIEELIKDSELELVENFKLADEISEYNQEKVLKAFNKHSIALRHLTRRRATVTATTGVLCLARCLRTRLARKRVSFRLRC